MADNKILTKKMTLVVVVYFDAQFSVWDTETTETHGIDLPTFSGNVK
jgi:hypothetical protein